MDMGRPSISWLRQQVLSAERELAGMKDGKERRQLVGKRDRLKRTINLRLEEEGLPRKRSASFMEAIAC